MTADQKILIGVGAVVFRGDEVLVIKRGKPPFEGHWSIPGGKLIPGETVKDAVRREVREETGLEIEILRLLDVFDAPSGDTTGRVAPQMVIIDYVAEWRAGEPVAADDALAAEFVSLEEAEARLSWDVTREAMRRAAAIRADFYARP
ncbi:MAG: NUDIX hydrolase [Hyphococcus sp.]